MVRLAFLVANRSFDFVDAHLEEEAGGEDSRQHREVVAENSAIDAFRLELGL